MRLAEGQVRPFVAGDPQLHGRDLRGRGVGPERVRRAIEAMFGMRKLDVAALRAAADGVALG